MNTNMKVIGGVVLGVAIGSLVGLLTAPNSGKQTRKKIDERSNEMKKVVGDAVVDAVNQIKKSYQKVINDASEAARQNKDIANRVSEKTNNVVERARP